LYIKQLEKQKVEHQQNAVPGNTDNRTTGKQNKIPQHPLQAADSEKQSKNSPPAGISQDLGKTFASSGKSFASLSKHFYLPTTCQLLANYLRNLCETFAGIVRYNWQECFPRFPLCRKHFGFCKLYSGKCYFCGLIE